MRGADPLRSRAVLIGADHYQHLQGLPAVHNNLAALRALLTDPGVWGLPPEHCTVLHNPHSPQTALDAVHAAASSAEEALLVYFAGHGLLSARDELHLALPDSTTAQLYRSISYGLLRDELVDTCSAPSRVVILDCCYSGQALAAHMGAGALPGAAGVEGTYLMTATAETKLAWAPPGEEYTAFTGELVKAVREGIPGAPAVLGMDLLFRRVRRELIAKGRPVPQQLARNGGHAIALVRNRRAGESAPPPEAGPETEPAATRGPGRVSRRVRARVRRGLRGLRRPGVRAGVAVAAALALAVPFSPLLDGGPEERKDGRPPAAPGGTSSRLGDHRTADPCALAVPGALARFGRTRTDEDYGNFDRCDMLVDTGDEEPVDVMIHFDSGGAPELSEPRWTRGAVTLVDEPAESGACPRTLLSAGDDKVNITIVAQQDAGTAPLCDMADAAAGAAAAVLDKGVRERSPMPPAASLIHEDACTLLTPRELGTVPGIDTGARDIGFGNWDCEWSAATGDRTVEVRFDRGQPPTGRDGALTGIGGRQAVVQPEGEGEDTCLIRVVHRSYTDQEGNTAVETVNITVGGDPSPGALRRMATRLAGSVVAALA
ncbi:caspase family protein [Streptomyces sp. CAU 1734]|uniref:caspase family protein n=1 Tax=Streptomyces sp. CAU 1734 TaxID=3140360 RepID=UPI0032607163